MSYIPTHPDDYGPNDDELEEDESPYDDYEGEYDDDPWIEEIDGPAADEAADRYFDRFFESPY